MVLKRKSSKARKGSVTTTEAASTSSIKQDDVDVVTEGDIDKMLAVLKKYLVVLASVQADWCGHCKTYKPIWDEYKNTKGRKIPMINVNEKMLAKTPFAKASIDGFPSTVLYSPKDNSFASFNKENGEATNSMPNSRDPKSMKKLLTTDPSKLQLVANGNDAEAEAGQEAMPKDSESPTIRSEMEEMLNASAQNALKNKNARTANMDANKPAPPNTQGDSLAPLALEGAPENKGTLKPKIMSNSGGSLYQRLLRAAAGKGPATRRRGKQLRRTAKHR